MFFKGGEISLHTFNEIRLAYIHGLNLATVLLSLAYIEHEVAGLLYMAGASKRLVKKRSFETILVEAYEKGILSEDELETFQHLRNVRNSYVHFRPIEEEGSLMSRSLNRDELPYEVTENEARKAIEALGSYIGRGAF